MPVTRMQQKRGTAAEWASTNPVLADGEIGFERDTGTIKVGNGYDTWQNLVPILRSVLAPTETEWNANTRILTNGEVAISRDTQIIKVGDGTKTWSQLPSVLASTFVGTKGGDTITAASPTVVPLKVRGATGHTANLLEWTNPAGTVVGGVTNDGGLSATANTAGRIAGWFESKVATGLPLVVRGASGQSVNLAEFQDTAGTVMTSIASWGGLHSAQGVFGGGVGVRDSYGSTVAGGFQAKAPSNIALVVRGAVGQTNDLISAQDSAGTQLMHVRADGTMAFLFGNARQSNAGFEVQAPASNLECVNLYGKAGQAANLQNWRRSDGLIMNSVEATGAFYMVKNASPVSNPAGGQLWTNVNGALYYRGPSGADTLIANG